ncbi:hypothetical protein PF008_g3760 [Phytophthora fragariae]|uniref:ubiquitinyl hydrolase 1 n=1 Tax=Phytophthora fragariae TaxID=53985 RepID=A0A6G0SF38_9STRA|nr:hypothetical protein PF008_g3760 [Phytophthora fragariae]
MATELREELQRDFEGACAAVTSDLAACDDPTQWLELLTALAASDLADRLDTELQPQVVQLLLGRAFDTKAVERVNAFLQWTLQVVAQRLQRGEIGRLSCVTRILDAHRRFYLFHGTSNDGQEDQVEQVEQGRFTTLESSEYTSRYFLRNLEHWGAVGGFSALLEVLRSSASSFEAMQCVLRMLYDVKDHLRTEFLLRYLPELIDAVCALLVTSLPSSDFYALSRDSLLEVVQVLELILVKAQHDAADAERHACERRLTLLRLEISRRFFQSSSLEKRIYGLTDIVVTVTRLYNEQIQEQAEPTVSSLYAELKFLVDWMHDKRLMQELLGDKMHVELVKRSTSLFQFASELERLPTEWIDLVWSCYHADADSDSDQDEAPRPVQRRHEAFRATIHDLLLEMATFMELPSLRHLVHRIEAVKAKLDLNQLGLLAAIAGRKLLADVPEGSPEDDAVSRRSLRQRILIHLWTIVLPSVKSEDVRDEVLLRVHEMLRLEVVGDDGEALEADRSIKDRSMVDEFLGLCLENIRRRQKLAISLKLFTQLASLVVEVDITVSTPGQSNTSYVQVLLDEIVEYKQGVRHALQASKWLEMEEEERAKLPALTDHVNEIKMRLLALRGAWILDEYSESTHSSFSEAQLDNVWELMVVEAFLLDEGALCFQWIELCMNTLLQTKPSNQENENACPARALMPLGIAEYLLTTKFSTLPGDCITLSTLCCFHSIFRRINLLKGGLEIFTTTASVGESSLIPSPTERPSSGSSSEGDKDESVELMTGQLLVGLDELWQLAVRATDSAVAEETITLLASFHLAFSPSARNSELPFQCKMRFLEKCMEFIATAKADAEIVRTHMLPSPASDQLDAADPSYASKLAADVAVVNRCVDLLRYFLEACRVGDDTAAKEDEEIMWQKLESLAISGTAEASGGGDEKRKNTFRIEHLEERLPYLEIYPSPMKDPQSEPVIGTRTGFRAGRRPSWTFRQQHALLDVIVDANEDAEVEDSDPAVFRKEEVGQTFDNSPLKVDLRAELMMAGSPVKTSMRSPCVRANLRWPQAPSPQRGPDLRPEDIDQALTDFTSGGLKDERNESEKQKTRYGIMSQILANQGSHFDVLLELVDWDEATSQRTWNLLCRLPTNNELLRKMIRLRSEEKDQEPERQVEWSDLLDGSNIHRLLYALRLVEALLIPIESEAKGNQELNSGRRQWRERFVRLGGARHLYETLLKWPVQACPDEGDSISSQYAQNIRATCLAAVMRVLNYFFLWSRLSSSEKMQSDTVSPFDLRLQTSTLPEFVEAIELPSMLQAAVQLTETFCSRKSQSLFSEEAAEAVYCGVQMCCSLIRFAPHLTITVFEPESDNGVVDDPRSRITMSKWLKALLVDCPSKPTRTQVFGALSEMAMAFGTMDVGSPARALYEPLVVSACFLVSENSVTGVSAFVDVEELFAFCRVLLGCSARSTRTSEDASEALTNSLIRRCIPTRLMGNLSRIVFQRQASATTRSIKPPRNQDEGVLGGHMTLLISLAGISEKIRSVILRCDPTCPSDQGSGLKVIQFVHNDLLFGSVINELDAPVPPICKTGMTRELAQRLLLNLAFPQASVGSDVSDLNGDMLTLLSYLHDHQTSVLETENLAGRQWNYAPADSFLDAEKSTHHAGLVNPGCICYMNSLVQQLFMLPSFCQGLLALDCSQVTADKSSSSWREEVEQLQKLFASLAYTNYRSSDPTAFALSHKDMDGNSTDVHVQMDADEFFSLLLDRLEMFIRPKPVTKSSDAGDRAVLDDDDKDFMARCFGGVLVNQILTQQGNLSEREEKFFALSLEVSKKRHLAESLELYVLGETLEGENAYFCERVQRKVSATKRVCIKTLPQTLVCHLKRFEFDYDTMEKVKINDYLEFPTELDMFPYTSEALAATDGARANGEGGKAIMYDLVGVVVHSGTSDTGHYYSFVKDRHDTDNQRWLEFNDEVVREFDVETMGDECFGGEEVAQKWDALQGTYSPIVQMKRRSAYMLIYERRAAEDESSPESEDARDLTLSSQVQTLAAEIIQENARYEAVVNTFDPIYDRFIHDLVESATRMAGQCDPRVVRQACQLGCQFLFGISSLRCRASASAQPSPVASTTTASAMTSSHYKISARVALWLSNFDKSPDVGAEDERRQFSKWILAEMVASPTTLSAKAAAQHAERQRTWLFDVLFLSPESPELAESCFLVLSAAVNVLAREAAEHREDEEKSLVAFFRESLNLFYSREPHLDVTDPASGCVLTLSMEMRVAAMKQLGAFLEKCMSTSLGNSRQGTKAAESCAIHNLFLEKLQFVNHFLLSLLLPCEVSDVTTIPASPAPSRGIAPLAIETRSSSPLREHDLRLCTFQLEIKLLRRMLKSYDKPVPLPADTTLVFNHTALKNVVLFDLEGIVLPILTRIIFESEAASPKCDRLVTLLIGVLEEVKDTHAEKVLAVFGELLDAEEKRVRTSEEFSGPMWTFHRHVFSPSRGILESVAYYRDHGSHEYTLLVLEFVLRRASRSPILQQLFKNDPKFHDSATWIPQWLVDHLDSNGAIRAQIREGASAEDNEAVSEKTPNVQEVKKLFDDVEKAFGVTVSAYYEDIARDAEGEGGPLLVSAPSSPPAITTEAVLLEALDLVEENQHDPSKDYHPTKHGSRWLGKISADIGPEHEGAEAETPTPNWTLQRSREELSMLLRIDLDTTHNSAREA